MAGNNTYAFILVNIEGHVTKKKPIRWIRSRPKCKRTRNASRITEYSTKEKERKLLDNSLKYKEYYETSKQYGEN